MKLEGLFWFIAWVVLVYLPLVLLGSLLGFPRPSYGAEFKPLLFHMDKLSEKTNVASISEFGRHIEFSNNHFTGLDQYEMVTLVKRLNVLIDHHFVEVRWRDDHCLVVNLDVLDKEMVLTPTMYAHGLTSRQKRHIRRLTEVMRNSSIPNILRAFNRMKLNGG